VSIEVDGCDLDFDPMTFIYELNPYCLEIKDVQFRRLSSDRHTDIHMGLQTDKETERIDRNYKPRRLAGGQW